MAMPDDAARPRLGRGLAALIGDFPTERSSYDREQRKVAVEFLRPNPRNPRRSFSETELKELAESIRMRGVIQPVVVRPLPGVPGTYEIVAGERRWRAAQIAGHTEIPIVVLHLDEKASLEYAILENVQRSDLNAIEEASGYERLMNEFKYTQRELAEILGKSRSHLANTLRLLQLPPAIQDRVINAEISAGHARALLSVRNPEAVAKRIVTEGLSVREIEAIATAEAEASSAEKPELTRTRRVVEKNAEIRTLEQTLARVLGFGVAVKAKPSGEGEIRIRYSNADEFEALCKKLDTAA
ncbi:Chromosome-partitioning protein ParB [Methylobacterium gnaphalii]|uniref:Chromosome partitioning protein ParB n=2 Tax=Methylobacterium gnaphalii TaxID=1010610 RepID=A0A512JHU1_9HYPH|nr:chromosome partitioning protein ParB [Methylobacterium gnaphalii]GJD69954.1 Chromosome-partitioning protein ParB [Methylobacterium gnaphalii]GLS48175.1 chromosome partitioning protein ParB [Methylobacterium gnaphalii]